ncbi:MAG TPA: hypothetical protein PLY86_14600 [bacterium]|nr:hypothetical protein [bacterium]
MTLTLRTFGRILVSAAMVLFSSLLCRDLPAEDLDGLWERVASFTPKFDETAGSIHIDGVTISVQDTGRSLITGIDLDKVVSRYLKNYDQFRKRAILPYLYGMTWGWRLKEIPEGPETGYSGGPKRRPRYEGPSFRLLIGVFRSHGQALLAAEDYLTHQQAYFPMDTLNPDDPGFVSWGGTYFVRDNVFYFPQITSDLNRASVWEQLHKDLRDGTEGITRGSEVPLPVILGDDFPSDMTVSKIEGKPTAPLLAKDPNGQHLWYNVWVADTDDDAAWRRLSKEEKMSKSRSYKRSPQVKWVDPNMVVVENPGSATVVDLAAIAMNDLCLVSDIWVKRVRIAPPK